MKRKKIILGNFFKKETLEIDKLNSKALMGVFNSYYYEKFGVRLTFNAKNYTIIKNIAKNLQENEIDFRKFSEFVCFKWKDIGKEFYIAKDLPSPYLEFVLKHLNNLIIIYRENVNKQSKNEIETGLEIKV